MWSCVPCTAAESFDACLQFLSVSNSRKMKKNGRKKERNWWNMNIFVGPQCGHIVSWVQSKRLRSILLILSDETYVGSCKHPLFPLLFRLCFKLQPDHLISINLDIFKIWFYWWWLFRLSQFLKEKKLFLKDISVIDTFHSFYKNSKREKKNNNKSNSENKVIDRMCLITFKSISTNWVTILLLKLF